MVGKGVDDTYLDEVFELTDADFAPAEPAAERLSVLTLDEAHTVLELLLHSGREQTTRQSRRGGLPMKSPRASPRPPDPWPPPPTTAQAAANSPEAVVRSG